MKENELDKRIESALNSLDHITRVGPGPFFYTRVLGRLGRKDRTIWERVSGFIAQPAVAFSVICLIISLNTLVIFKTKTSPSFTEQSSSIASDDSDVVDTIASYYEENNSNTDPQ